MLLAMFEVLVDKNNYNIFMYFLIFVSYLVFTLYYNPLSLFMYIKHFVFL